MRSYVCVLLTNRSASLYVCVVRNGLFQLIPIIVGRTFSCFAAISSGSGGSGGGGGGGGGGGVGVTGSVQIAHSDLEKWATGLNGLGHPLISL